MCCTMWRVSYNSSSDHENKVFFWYSIEAFWDFLRRKKSESLFQYIEYSKIESNISLTNTSKYHNINYKRPEYFIEMDIN